MNEVIFCILLFFWRKFHWEYKKRFYKKVWGEDTYLVLSKAMLIASVMMGVFIVVDYSFTVINYIILL